MALNQTRNLSKKKIVFIDSSVLIAAAISPKGRARDLINETFTQKLDLYVSADVLEETERNLKLKAPHGLDYFYTSMQSLSLKIVKPAKRQILKAAKIVVGKDAPILAGAIEEKVDYLVTYDRKHLLSHKEEIKTHFNLQVVTPDEII